MRLSTDRGGGGGGGGLTAVDPLPLYGTWARERETEKGWGGRF